MSESKENMDDPTDMLEALAHEVPTEASNARLEALLARLSSAEREHWRLRVVEAQVLRDALANAPMPATLTGRLLALPEGELKPAARRRFFSGTRVLVYAAGLLIVIGTSWLYMRDPAPAARVTLSSQTAESVAAAAVAVHTHPPALAIASADSAAVETSLKAKMPGFPAIVLQPRKKMELLGGGVCTLGSSPAAFTRWKDGEMTYTLFQFEPGPWKIPANFGQMVATAGGTRVSLWPGSGNACTWALVMESAQATDTFSY